MGFTKDLIEGVAEHLSAPVDSPFEYRSDGSPYATGELGIYAMVAPLEKTRGLSVVIRAYDAADDPSLSDTDVSIQLDFYGPSVPLLDGIDYAFDRLHGLWGGTLGGVKIQQITRTSGAPMGQDEGGNLRQTENYNLAVHRPSTYRQ